MFKFHLITQFHITLHILKTNEFDVFLFLEYKMSDISNTNGAGDAENVAKVSRFYIHMISYDMIHITLFNYVFRIN